MLGKEIGRSDDVFWRERWYALRKRRCRPQRLVQIPQDILDIFKPDGETNQVGRDAASGEVLCRELLVRGAGGMNDQAARVADVGQVREKLHRVDHRFASLVAALDAEGEESTRPPRQIAIPQPLPRIVR